MKTVLTYLGHSSFKLDSGKTSIVIDPYKNGSVPGLVFPKGISANAVICSHAHDDHNAINEVNVIGGDLDFTYDVIPCYHDNEHGALRGPNKIFVIHINCLTVVHLGDLGHDLDDRVIETLHGCDVLLAPINGHFTLGAEDIVSLAKRIQPKIIIPMHYYRKKDNSGYPDGGEIDVFLGHFTEVVEVKDSFVIEDEIKSPKVIIFK